MNCCDARLAPPEYGSDKYDPTTDSLWPGWHLDEDHYPVEGGVLFCCSKDIAKADERVLCPCATGLCLGFAPTLCMCSVYFCKMHDANARLHSYLAKEHANTERKTRNLGKYKIPHAVAEERTCCVPYTWYMCNDRHPGPASCRTWVACCCWNIVSGGACILCQPLALQKACYETNKTYFKHFKKHMKTSERLYEVPSKQVMRHHVKQKRKTKKHHTVPLEDDDEEDTDDDEGRKKEEEETLLQ
jgi:hypothetical protein